MEVEHAYCGTKAVWGHQVCQDTALLFYIIKDMYSLLSTHLVNAKTYFLWNEDGSLYNFPFANIFN